MTTDAGQPQKSADLDEIHVMIGSAGVRYRRPSRVPGEVPLDLDPALVLDELGRRHQVQQGTATAVVNALAALLFLAGAWLVASGIWRGNWGQAGLGAVGCALIVAIRARGFGSRRIKLFYEYDESAAKIPALLDGVARSLQSSQRLAADLIGVERAAGVARRPPAFVDTEARVVSLRSNDLEMFFLPDRILVARGPRFETIEYPDLDVRPGSIRVKQTGVPPADAKVVGTSWKYSRKDGGPDLRYRDNPATNLLEFGTLKLTSKLSWTLSISTSRLETAEEVASSLRNLKSELKRITQPSPLPSTSVPLPRVPPAAKETALPVWKGRGSRIEVGPFVIDDPLTYLVSGSPRFAEASCIDLGLPVGSPLSGSGHGLGSYITYTGLTPDQRATYLAWLAQGRTGRLGEISYAFLFFYGLERRLMVDESDHAPVVEEAVRLLETQPNTGAFSGYVRKFLAHASALGGIGTLDEAWFDRLVLAEPTGGDDETIAASLAWLFSNDRPLPARWAFRIARDDPRTPRSVVPDRVPDAFRELFLKRYRETHGEGKQLKAARRDREMIYQPASPSLLSLKASVEGIKPTKIPHVLGIQSQFTSLVDLWTTCVEELKPAGRVVGKSGDVKTRAAHEALPPEIRAVIEHPDKPAWEKIALEFRRDDGSARVPIARLAEIQGIESRPKLTLKQSTGIADTAGDVGFLIEPDPRMTGRAFAWDDRAALLRIEQSQAPGGKDSKYQAAALMLEIGMYVASADGEIVPREVDHVASFLESRFHLDPTEIRRLEALKGILVENPPSLTGVGKRVEALLDDNQREAVGRFLVGVAAAGGSIDAKEVKALRAAYKALSIDTSKLDVVLDEFRVQDAEADENEAQPPIILNEALLRRIMGETEQVARLLGEAMNDVEPEEEPGSAPESPAAAAVPPAPQKAPAGSVRLQGLEIRYQAILLDLTERSTWSKREFEDLARRHSLMPSGTMDVINEWAESSLGDLVLEEQGTTVVVHVQLIPKE